jgi:DNA-directed RNA polymerase specialized sigma subunit
MFWAQKRNRLKVEVFIKKTEKETSMKQSSFTEEQVIKALREQESRHKTVEQICKELGISQSTWPLFIEPGSPWQNGKCESFNGRF